MTMIAFNNGTNLKFSKSALNISDQDVKSYVDNNSTRKLVTRLAADLQA
jgi:hypothetical protein